MLLFGFDLGIFCIFVNKDVNRSMTMCGIVACSSTKMSQQSVVAALGRMQYRGYDSYGFAYLSKTGDLLENKSIDRFNIDAIELPESQIILGHTRWATHGGVSLSNSHPHVDKRRRFALVHNGIVDNFLDLKNTLLSRGTVFESETDTEVLLHLMSECLVEHENRVDALYSLWDKVEGRNTLLFLFDDGELLGLRQGSPLVLGRGKTAHYMASDILAFAADIDYCLPLADGQVVSIKAKCVNLYSPQREAMAIDWQEVNFEIEESNKKHYRHFMLKEIGEQWSTIPSQLDQVDEVFWDLVKYIRERQKDKHCRVVLTGAGGAFLTAKQVVWFLNRIALMPALVFPAYEFEQAHIFVEEGDVLIAISQSGETADTLNAIEMARSWDMKIACVVNMRMSTMSQTSDWVLYNQLGAEECVLSTKSASAQISFGYLLAHAIKGDMSHLAKEFSEVSHRLSLELNEDQYSPLIEVAHYLAKQNHVYILGKGQYLAVAMIAALNIKEASYLHAEAFSAGELKHGVLALISSRIPVILFISKNDKYMLGVAAEVKSRGGHLIAILEDKDMYNKNGNQFDHCLLLPANGAPVGAIITCQLIAYYVALARNLDPDRPRNLAKSVTVQ
ncbi:MAG: glucosamine--fructose-6-phosphate aminotransferase (isomerizing) [Candidatus Azotimanducaceae bacterium]|jgi:glucosamine--fructose-6-phosphate aminotransferase (isomerizing)